jgi:transposase
MQAITTIGLDIAKSVFQVHGIDAEGNVTLRRQLKRRYVLNFFQRLPPCLVGIEACASAHHWSRELQTLGHTVRLMPPAYVKPYVKRHKNDATDAEAICEAVTRANMRFVATKTPAQQSCLTLHRTRHLFIRQQTSVINAIRAHLAEFGIVAPIGRNGVEQLLSVAADANDKRLPEVARACVCRTDAGYIVKPPARLARSVPGHDHTVELQDLSLQCLQLGTERGDPKRTSVRLGFCTPMLLEASDNATAARYAKHHSGSRRP